METTTVGGFAGINNNIKPGYSATPTTNGIQFQGGNGSQFTASGGPACDGGG
jgi:hypothetical protein